MLMNSMGNYYELGTPSTNPSSSSSSFLPGFANNPILAGPSISPLMFCSSKPSSALSPEAKARAACKSHKEAERRRRKRINGHLATLRTLLPNLIKTDKASVLGEVVRRVRELKKATTEVTADRRDGDACLLPGDTDEVNLSPAQNDATLLMATLCCEDRPELILDLTRALRSVKAKVVRAEMATVGGRTKTVLWVRGGGGPEGLLKRALKVVVDKPPSSGIMGHGLMGTRIQGLYS